MHHQELNVHRLANGMTLVVETMRNVQSAAFTLLLPSGSVFDPPDQNGVASVLATWLLKGAGKRGSQELTTDLDNLGVQRSESVGVSHLMLNGATLSHILHPTLEIYADIVRSPHLADEHFESSTAYVEQMLGSIEDEPRQKVMQELRRRTFKRPWGLPPEGSLDDLPRIDPDDVRQNWGKCVRPQETILGIAGNVEFEAVKSWVEELFGDWDNPLSAEFKELDSGPTFDHLQQESTQTQIGIAYPSVPYRHPDYYTAWAAVGVLSGGMSSRLFTEVREKRGLCYSVYASLNSLPHDGRVICYAGTTNERAQETLDVTLQVIRELKNGIGEDELARCKARAKSSLIMQQESTMARSSSVARDWFHLGEVQTLNDIHKRIEELTPQAVLEHVHQFPAQDFTILTIGPEMLEIPNDL
ncbi:MAG: pitrilysin family protein [Planctomycetota bacterium]|nr:pitrilysin family protein [Planctomycetota bacterium]MDA1212647.1 pitrilysin family protein [Planctomycetota bacterium]